MTHTTVGHPPPPRHDASHSYCTIQLADEHTVSEVAWHSIQSSVSSWLTLLHMLMQTATFPRNSCKNSINNECPFTGLILASEKATAGNEVSRHTVCELFPEGGGYQRFTQAGCSASSVAPCATGSLPCPGRPAAPECGEIWRQQGRMEVQLSKFLRIKEQWSPCAHSPCAY
jgi:hypothetical protein